MLVFAQSDDNHVGFSRIRVPMTVPQDVRYGFRRLNNNLGFTSVAVACLALGICASVTVFNMADSLLLRSIPGVADPGRIVTVGTRPTRVAEVEGEEFSPAVRVREYQRYRDLNRAFTGLAAYSSLSMNVSGAGEPIRVNGELVSDNYFTTLGLRGSLGRLFVPGEAAGEMPGAVISQRLWRHAFGSRRRAIGKPLELNGHPFVVVGVAPEGFRGVLRGVPADVWIPLENEPLVQPGLQVGPPGERRWLSWFFGRLAPGMDLARAQAEMDRLTARLGEGLPRDEKPPGLVLYPGLGVWPGQRDLLIRPLVLLAIVAGLLMLVIYANLSGLLLVKAAARQEEIGVRLALGVTRSRLVRQLLAESLALSLVGGAAGFLMSLFTVDLIRGLSLGRYLPPIDPPTVGGRVVLVTLGLCLAAGTLCGLAPALWATRRQAVPLLRGGTGDGVMERKRTRLQELFVVGQVTVSLMLLVSTGLFVRTLQNLRSVDTGFQSQGVVNLRIDLAFRGYDRARGLALYSQLLEQVRRLPDVRAAALTLTVPLAKEGGQSGLSELRPADEPAGETRTVEYNVVSPGFFKTLGIPLVGGRDFSDGDGENSPPVVIVDQRLANLLWPGRSPVGQRLAVGGEVREVREVVGVAGRIRFWELPNNPSPYFYVPLAQYYRPGMALQVRAVGDPQSVADPIRALLKKHDPSLAVQVSRFEDEVQESLSQPRLFSWLLGIFSATALLVTAIGLYVTLAYAVSRRTRELGIRMALGARASEIVIMVLRRGLFLTLTGLALGMLAASWATAMFSGLLFGVEPTDPAVFVSVAFLLILVGLAASSLPAYRATRVDPMTIIRHE